ncbi:hypothetical protein [Kitasatospora sp. NPDC101183]|uniref:hypothetical protein n=1 Tax=Kitasatospora sp. NPDC101183 TaxID=3364100 RepID=UPI0038136B10
MADGLSPEERAVRALMHHAVDDIQPDPAALAALRQAVPRRRAARRGAWTGAAALTLAVAVAMPALHGGEHLGLSGGPGSPDAKGPAVGSPGSSTGTTVGGSGVSRPGRDGWGGTATPSGAGPASPSAGSGRPDGAATASTGATSSVLVPLCARADLGQGAAQVGAVDAAGRVYGSFTVYNVSDHSCRLGGPGAVSVTAVTGADRTRVRTADHSPGDPAEGLPAMDAEPPVLAPQAGYRVPFAWVPDQTCGTGTGTTTGSTTGTNQPAAATQAPAASQAPAAGTSAAPPVNPQATTTPSANPSGAPSPTATPPTGNPSPAPATATLAHTPAPGSPTAATATVPVPCPGTVYRGGVQPAAAPAPGTPTTH